MSRYLHISIIVFGVVSIAVVVPGLVADDETAKVTDSADQLLNPAAWGSDHVGKPLPEYVTGDECLFCHRDIGPTWPDNRHTLTIRQVAPDDQAVLSLRNIASESVDEVTHVMGRSRITRFLKRSNAYGKFDLLSVKHVPRSPHSDDNPTQSNLPHWDEKRFADRCAGCHATAVDTATRAFSATSIDCMACHGSVDLAHTKDAKVVLLSKQNREPREVISICGQCHLRGGKSLSSALPYPNTFVAGDNLFRDFKVDLSSTAINGLNPMDRHVFENARDVAVLNQAETTCLSCHDVHQGNSDKHQELHEVQRCTTCHVADGKGFELSQAFLDSRGPLAHSHVCDY